MRNKKVNNDKQYHYSIRKLSVGVVSVAVSAFIFLGGPVALADQVSTDVTTSEVTTNDTSMETQAEATQTVATDTTNDNTDEAKASNASQTAKELTKTTTQLADTAASDDSINGVASSESANSKVHVEQNLTAQTLTSDLAVASDATTTQEADKTTATQADAPPATETLEGYEVSKPATTGTVADPVQGRYTYEVVQDNTNGVTYVFSIDDTVEEENLLTDKGPRYVYLTRFKDGSVISTDTIDRSASEGTKLTFDNNTEVGIITGNAIQIGTTDTTSKYRVLYNAVSTPSGQDVSTINIATVRLVNQVTKYVNDVTGEEIRDPYIQTTWRGYDYTTQPLEFKYYRYVRSTDNTSGVVSSNQPRNKGDVLYTRSTTTINIDGGDATSIQPVTIYREMTFIDDNQTVNTVIYVTPRVNEGEEQDAQKFFENMENYNIYNRKVYVPTDDIEQPNQSGVAFSELATNDKTGYYLARIAAPLPENVPYSVRIFSDSPITTKQAVDTTVRFGLPISGPKNFYQENMPNRINSPNRKSTSSYVVYYYVPQGEVIVHYEDTEGNVIKNQIVDTSMRDILDDDGEPVAYNTSFRADEIIRTFDREGRRGKTYRYKGVKKESDPEYGYLPQGTTNVTYIYEEVKGDVVVLYRTKDGTELTGIGSDYSEDPTKTVEIGSVTDTETAEKKAWTGAVVDTPASSTGTDYDTSDSRPETITTADGKIYHRIANVSGIEQGRIGEGTTRVVYYYELTKGSVLVQYVDTNGNKLAENKAVLTDVDSGTNYDTLTDTYHPTEIKVGDKVYHLVQAGKYPVGDVGADGNLTKTTIITLGNDAPAGKVSDELKAITYVYQEVSATPEVKKGSVTIHYVDEAGKVIKDPVKDESDVPVGTDYDTTDEGDKPEKIVTTSGKTYTLVKTKGVEKGKVVEGNTDVTYVYKEVFGDVWVQYVDINGDQIKDQELDTAATSTGTEYDTSDHRSETIKRIDGKLYKLVPAGKYPVGEVDAKGHLVTSDSTEGKVAKGTKTVTYVYRELGSYVPYIPEEPGRVIPKVPYDETPEEPSDNPPLPHIPGYTPKDPNGDPLKPVDPADPTKGYIPPPTIDPADPSKDTPVPYVKDPEKPTTPKGNVVVNYVDEEGNFIAKTVEDTPESDVGTDYDTTDHKVRIIEKDGKRYIFVKVKDGDKETGKVTQGITTITYIYKELGSYVPYIPEEPGRVIPKVPYDETPEEPKDNPPLPYIPGYKPELPLDPVDPADPTKGYIPPPTIDPADPSKDTPVPYVAVGNVVVKYVDEEGNKIAKDVVDTPESKVGTEYDTTDNKPRIIKKDGKRYIFTKVKDGDKETGKVTQGITTITYIYKELGSYVPYIPGEPGKEIPKVPYDETPEEPKDNPPLPYIPGYKPELPLDPVDPDDPTKGYIPPPTIDPKDPSKDTPVPYVKDPDKQVGNVVVKYVDEKGNKIAKDVVDTPESKVGTEYDTTDNKPRIIKKDGKRYVFTKVKDGDKETGKVTQGITTITYIYKELGSYVPYIPGEPGKEIPKVPYDETPEEPKDNPPLPYIPGYTPKDPNGDPLKPVDPADPTKGYIPPPTIDPNDPSKDTPVPYVKDPEKPTTPKGNVVVNYVDEEGNFIAKTVEDTPESDVGTDYDTTDHKVRIIAKDGKRYIFVKVKDGANEKGKVTAGTTTITYIYRELGSYIPYIPEEPGRVIPKVPYDETPEEPSDNPPLPYIPGYTPKDPNGDPLKPVDPADPTKGYIPPPTIDPNDPSKDTPVPYVKDPEEPGKTPEGPGERPQGDPTPGDQPQNDPTKPTTPAQIDPQPKQMTVRKTPKVAKATNEAKELPQTGENDDHALAGLGILSVLAGSLGLFFRRKKDDNQANE